MRTPPLPQTERMRRMSVQIPEKPRLVGKKTLAALSWLAVLGATAAAFYGTGHFVNISAAGGPGTVTGVEAHGQHDINGCTLTVPANPLTAKGLATPYLLSGTVDGAACHESSVSQSAFVQATVLDPATGAIAVYDPLVVDQGSKPAVAPVVPTLPANAVVGIWFGSNANGLHLRGATFDTITSAKCANGLGQSVFGQFGYCNAATFFGEANKLIAAGKLTPPALGQAHDGLSCPTVRDFSVVDQDQSDNVTTTYRITQDGHMAQNTAANSASLAGSVKLGNGSDNGLLSSSLDTALGCASWHAPDLADPGQMASALPLNELQAARYQASPVALVPSGDPMVTVNGNVNLSKQNLYRLGVDQPAVVSARQARTDQVAYCRSLLSVAPTRLVRDETLTSAASSPSPSTANSLFTFLAARLQFTVGPDGLNCTGLLKVANPVTLTQQNGMVVGAVINTKAGA